MMKNRGKKALSGLFSLALIVSLFSAMPVKAGAVSSWNGVIPAANAAYLFSGGSGTEVAPYEIDTAADLAQLSANVQGGTVYAGKYFVMTDDISLSPASASDATVNPTVAGTAGYTGGGTVYEWLPIGGGNTSYSFQGHFDGNDCTIYNIFYNQSTGSYGTGNSVANNIGLFGKLEENASIRNLTISGGYVGAQRSVGGLVGKGWGDIANCVNDGTVVYGNEAKGVGGIIGANWVNTATNPPSILNSANYGKVIIGYSSGSAGGIAGENEGTILNCWNAGEVISPYNAGGLVGSNKNDYNKQTGTGGTVYGGISNSYNNGTVTGGIAGGIAAFQKGSMRNCYNIGDITGSTYAGELIGEMSSSLTNDALRYEGSSAPVGHLVSGSPATVSFSSASGLLSDLNGWVSAQSGGDYSIWTIDPGENSGYPIFA